LVSGSEGATGDRGAHAYHNEGIEFVSRSFLTGISFASAAWGDFDGDFDTDLVVSGVDRQNARVLNVYRNEQRTPNAPPQPPTNLTATSAGGVATLSWSPSTDDHTASGSLSYNVRVGTTSGASDVVSSSTRSGSAQRLHSARGNVDLVTSVSFALPQGQYYWSVQAID